MTSITGLDQLGKAPATLTREGQPPVFVSPYGHAQVTGSMAVTCEYNGELYFAVCKRPGEGMTFAGTTMRLNLPDGNAPFGPEDASPQDAALRSLKDLFGLTPDQFPALKAEPLSKLDRNGAPASDIAVDKSKPIISKRIGIRQIAHDYGVHLGIVSKLPELQGKDSLRGDTDSSPAWLRLRDVEQVKEGDKITYRYNGDSPLYPKGAEVFPDGGMNIIENLAAKVRDLPFRQKGYDGATGFLQLNPVRGAQKILQKNSPTAIPETQAGEQAAQFYEQAAQSLNLSPVIPRS